MQNECGREERDKTGVCNVKRPHKEIGPGFRGALEW